MALAGLAIASTISQWATVKIYSNPPGVLDSTSYVPTGSVTNIAAPPMSANGARFTHWTVNGVRQVDAIGISQASLSLTITNSVDIVAQYTTETQDEDADLVPDWYELLQYGTLATGANDDTDGDGQTLTEEYVRGSQPQIRDGTGGDGIVQGGISRRRSPPVPVRNATSPQFYSYTESSLPPGAITRQEWVPPGTSLTTTAPALEQWGYKFGQWKLNGVRQESSSGMAVTQVTFTVTQDTMAVAEYVAVAEDTDGDSIPDWYEIQQYGSLLTGATDDTDGDGVGFLDEYTAGTQPRIADYASGGGILEGGISRRRSEPIRFLGSSTYFSYTERSEPPGVVNVQSSHPTGTSITTSNQNGETWGYRFTHWTLNGVRQQTASGLSASQLTFSLAENTVAVANFLPSTQDLDADQVPDWYEIQQYGSLAQGADVDTDGDGLGFYDEYLRGTQPLVQDNPSAGSILEGGTSRRRGASATVDLSLLLEDFNLATNPTQESNVPVKVGELTSTSSAIGLVVTTNPGFQVFLVSGKYEIWTSGPTDYETTPLLEILLTVMNSRGTAINLSGTVALTDNRFEDVDGDGLTEAQEEDTYGTSDLNPESDGDGYRDGAEVTAGTNPADPHSFPWEGEIPLPSAWVKVANGTARDLGFRGDRFVSVEQSSVDGTAWHTNSYGTNVALFNFAGYGDGLWWGTGTNGSLRAGTNTDLALLSWQSRTSGETNDLAQLAYGERTYLARGPGTSGGAIRSTNGSSWSQVGTAVGASNARSLVFAGGRFLLAAGSEIRSMPSGGSGTWITNQVTNRPTGFLLTNLLARNGTVYAGSSLSADTNGRRTMVVGQSTNGTNWSFQTSSLTLPSGVELAEVAQGLYLAVPTTTNGNAWFLVSSNASNWLRVGGAWTNGRVARGIAAGAGQLAVATDDGVYAGRFNRTGKDFATTHENFTAALDTNWTIRKPFSDSDVTVTGGNLRLVNRGTLILEKEFDGAFEVSGRLRFAGSEYDSLRIVYASDKTSTSPSREMDKGVALSLSSRGGDWPPFGPKITIGALNYPAEGTLLGSANPTVAMNTWTDFRITDDGRTIRVFWDDLVNPVISTNYAGSRRGYFAIYNREGSGGGSSISAGSVVEVERLTVRGAELVKQAQTISFPLLSQKTYGDAPFSLGATASSGLPLSYSSENTAVAVVATNGIATITGVGTSRITASQGGNTNYYAATPVERTLTVVTRPITIRADDLTRGYGETNPPLTSRVSAGSLVAGHTFTASLSTTATASSLGANSPYAITVGDVVVRDASGNDVTANYQITRQAGQLLIPSLPQTITFPAIAGKTYGDPAFSLGATASSGLPVTYSVADPTVAVVATNGVVTILRTGTTAITASQAGSSLYDPAPAVSRNLVVSTLALTLRADDKSRMFGQTNPPLTYSITSGSLVSGHVATVSLSTTATTNSPASATPYPITVDSVVVRNGSAQDVSVHYLLSTLSGGLTVTGTAPVFTSTNSFSGTVGVVFSNTVTANGTMPTFFRGSNLPSGLNLATNGLISGTPTTAGTNVATLTASNSVGWTNQNATFRIGRGTPVISNWPTAAPISYGQAVSNSVLTGGSANVEGSFTWDNPTNRPNTGTNFFRVTFTPTATNNYENLSTNLALVVQPAAAVLSWSPTPTAGLTYPAPLSSSQLNATSSVAGDFDYDPPSGTVLNAGTNFLTATFRPTDTNRYFGGVTISNRVVVAKGSNAITFGSLPAKQLGDAAFILTATASSGLPVSYTSSDPSVATVSSNTVSIVGVGTTIITANQTGNENWSTALPVTNSFTVLPRTPVTISGITVLGKEYDGSRGASVDWSLAELEGVGAGHDVQLVTDSAVAEFDTANAGTGKTVSVTGLGLSGAAAGRYELGPVLLLSGDITKRDLLLGGLAVLEKRYDGTVAAPLDWSNHSLSGYATNEGTNQVRVAQPYARGKYQTAWVGTNKALIGWFELPVLEGTGSANYRLVFPTNLTGTVLKGWAGIGISNTNQVYGKTNRTVGVAVTNLTGTNLVLEVVYEGTNGTVYGPSSNGPVEAGEYRVLARVAETDNTYEGMTNGLLRISPKPAVITAISDTIRAGTLFGGNRYTGSGFLAGDEPAGTLATHLRSVTNTNPLVGYSPIHNQSGVYRILRGSAGDNVTNNYLIDYREGILTVVKESLLTEGAVAPLGAGFQYTLVVQSNATAMVFGGNTNGVTNLPSILTNGTAEVAGVGAGAAANFGLAWTRDGLGVVWGSLTNTNTLTNVAGMAGGSGYVGYLRGDGTVGVWGTTNGKLAGVPGVLTQSNGGAVGLAAGDLHVLAVRTNGTVVGWGDYASWGGSATTNAPAGLSNAVGVGAGNLHGVALRADGTVVAWGANSQNVTNVPAVLAATNTAGFVRGVAVAAGYQYTLVLRADGSVRGWGNGAPTNLPAALSNSVATNPIVSLAVERHHAVALQRDGTVTTWLPLPLAESNTATLTVPEGLKGRVPMGGADSDRDGWANEAELRVGSDPLSTHSVPVKASFGVTFNYGTNGSTFQTNRTVAEGTNRTVGTLEILDSMGRREDGNQTHMTVELSEQSLKTFEAVDRTNRVLRFRADPAYDAGQMNNNVHTVDVIVRDSPLAAPVTTTLTVNVGNVAPQITGSTTFSVEENVALGTAVGTLQASEGNVSWAITAGNGLGLLAIDAQTGQIRTAAPIDYEALTDKTITLQVRVTDAGGEAGSAPVAITVSDVGEGMTPGDWLEPGQELTPALLTKYAVGGAVSPTGPSVPPSLAIQTDGSGQPVLAMTVLVRINDPLLSVQAEAVGSLGDFGNPAQTTVAGGIPAVDQSGVPEGFQRQVFTVPATGNRQFLRLKVSR